MVAPDQRVLWYFCLNGSVTGSLSEIPQQVRRTPTIQTEVPRIQEGSGKLQKSFMKVSVQPVEEPLVLNLHWLLLW